MRSDTGKRFPEALKRKIATDVSVGRMTIAEARREYAIKGGNTLKGWINKYADGNYVPGKRGRKPSAFKKASSFGSATMAFKPLATDGEVNAALARREMELEQELQKVRSIRQMLAAKKSVDAAAVEKAASATKRPAKKAGTIRGSQKNKAASKKGKGAKSKRA